MTWTDQQNAVISALLEASSFVSLVGTLSIIVSYLGFREIRQFQLRLIFFLAICDFLVSIVWILNRHLDITKPLVCDILAAGLEFFELTSCLWSICLAFALDQVIRLNNDRVEKFEKYFHIFSWSIPTALAVASYYQGLYINTGLWCWLSDAERGLFRWIYFYAIIVATLIYVVVVYIRVSKKITATAYLTTPLVASNEATILKTFKIYIIGWAICWLPAIADRIQDEIDPGHPIYILDTMHAFLTPLAGFFNAVAYGFNDEIQEQYANLFRKCCGSNLNKSIPSSSRYLPIPSDSDIDKKRMKETLREYNEESDR